MPEKTNSEIINSIKIILTTIGKYKYTGYKIQYPEINVNMQFDAIFEGPETENNLVLIEIKDKIDLAVYNRFRQFNLLLSKVESSRSVSFILVTNKLGPEIISRFQELGRTIQIDPNDSESDYKKKLIPLLPLDLPKPQKRFQAAEKLLKQNYTIALPQELEVYIKAARDGKEQVEKLINRQIDQILNFNGPSI